MAMAAPRPRIDSWSARCADDPKPAAGEDGMPDQDIARPRPLRLTEAEARILSRVAGGETLVQSLVAERLWSLLQDPFTVFDDVSPRRLRNAGLIELLQAGSLRDDRADSYMITEAGRAALKIHDNRRA